MSLGSMFPAQIVRARITANLKPGTVIKHVTVMDDGNVHEKRFVVLSVSADTMTCVVNSQISNFIKNRPNMLCSQVLMEQSDHPYMSWDSHVDCSQVKTYKTTVLVDQLCDKPEWILGAISSDLQAKIIDAINNASTINTITKQQCCADLGSVDLSS